MARIARVVAYLKEQAKYNSQCNWVVRKVRITLTLSACNVLLNMDTTKNNLVFKTDVNTSLEALQEALEQVRTTAQSVENLLTDDKLEKVNQILAKIEVITSNLPKFSEESSLDDLLFDLVSSILGKAFNAMIGPVKEVSIIVIFLGVASYTYFTPEPINVALTLSLGTYIMFRHREKFDFSALTSFLDYFDSTVKSQLDSSTIEDISTTLTTLISSYVMFTTKVDVPKYILKSLCDFSKIKGAISEIFTMLIRAFEYCYNYVMVDILGYDRGASFIATNIEALDSLNLKIKKVFDRENAKTFYVNEENFSHLTMLIEECKIVLTSMPETKTHFRFKQLLNMDMINLQKIRTSFAESNYCSSGFRQEPVAFILKGGPGCGKTAAITALSQAVCSRYLDPEKQKQMATDPMTFIHNRQFETGYWEGYDSKKFVTIFDDLGQNRDVAGNPDNEFMNLIRAVNSFPFHLNMAGLQYKGNVQFNSLFVFSTTNMVKLTSESIVSLEALNRRFDRSYIVIPKPEYTLKETRQNDYFNRKFDRELLPEGRITFNTCHFIPETPAGYGAPMEFDEVANQAFIEFDKKVEWYRGMCEDLQRVRDQYRVPIQAQMATLSTMNSQGIPEDFIDYVCNNIPSLDPDEAYDQYREQCKQDFLDAHDTTEYWHAREIKKWFVMYFDFDSDEEKYDEFVAVRAAFETIYEFSSDKPNIIEAVLTCGFLPPEPIYGLAREGIKLNFVRYRKTNVIVSYTEGYLREIIGDFHVLCKTKVPQIMAIAVGIKWLARSLVLYFAVKVITTLYRGICTYFPAFKIQSQSFGHSDKMRSHRNPKALQQEIRGLVPQMDTSGVDLVDSIIRSNCYEFHLESGLNTGKFTRAGFATFVMGRYFIIPYHFITTMLAQVKIDPEIAYAKVKLLRRGTTNDFCYIMDFKHILHNFQGDQLFLNDLAIVLAPKHVQPHTNRLKNFALRSDWGLMQRSLPFRLVFPGYKEKSSSTGHVIATADAYSDIPVNENDKYRVRYSFGYLSTTRPGDCGAVFTVLNPKMQTRKIMGFHVAAALQRGFSAAICQEDIMHDMDLFPHKEFIVDDDFVDKLIPEDTIIGQGQFFNMGKLTPAPSAPEKTTIIPSPLHGAWGEPLTCPALLKPQMMNGIFRDPVLEGLDGYCLNQSLVDKEILSDSTFDAFYRLVENSPILVEERVFTYREACEGLFYESDFGPIDRSTSAGWPFNCSNTHTSLPKKQHFWGSGPQFDFTRSESRELENTIMSDIERYKKGQRVTEIFTYFPKDERRAPGKLTRGVAAGTTAITVKFRMYFGAFTLWLHKNRVFNGLAIGVNPYSDEWSMIAEELLSVRDGDMQVIAGDFKGLDKTELPQIHYEILHEINEWYNDGPENRLIREMLFLEISFSRHIFRGNVLQWPSSLPSGNPLTTTINSLYVMVSIQYYCRRKELPWDCFKIIILGDDHVISVKPEYDADFNGTLLPPILAELGLVYTDDRKSELIPPSRPITDIEFLKRAFTYCELTNRWIAPFRMTALLEVPYWSRTGAMYHSITISNFEFMLRELTLHGRRIYTEKAPLYVKEFKKRMPFSPLKIDPTNWKRLYYQVLETTDWFF
jgi:hypothetical protein